jgi:AGCS family alanine or glycine:cation symporter
LIDGDLITRLSNLVWGQWTIALLVLVGIVMTVYSRGIQFREFRSASRLVMRGLLRRDPAARAPGEISPFQALTTAMAATIGNGNIAGVATAIAIGGPGAAFWMAAIAPLGMATKYAETFFGIRYRRKMPDGSMLGGPMVYLSDGAGLKGLGFAFALCITLGAIGAGNLAQANSVALVMFTQFAIPKWLSGLLLAGVLATVIVGGIKRIGQVAERLVPAMVLLYVAGVVVTLIVNIEKVPAAFQLILSSAFSPVAATGGFAGSTVARTIEYGIRRGVISSEAGLGSAGIAHSAAKTSDPERQGTIAMMGVFIDTVIVCMATALTVVVTGVWNEGEMSSAMVASAFNTSIPYGGSIIAICSLFFGFTFTVLRFYLAGRLVLLWRAGTALHSWRKKTRCRVSGALVHAGVYRFNLRRQADLGYFRYPDRLDGISESYRPDSFTPQIGSYNDNRPRQVWPLRLVMRMQSQ